MESAASFLPRVVDSSLEGKLEPNTRAAVRSAGFAFPDFEKDLKILRPTSKTHPKTLRLHRFTIEGLSLGLPPDVRQDAGPFDLYLALKERWVALLKERCTCVRERRPSAVARVVSPGCIA